MVRVEEVLAIEARRRFAGRDEGQQQFVGVVRRLDAEVFEHRAIHAQPVVVDVVLVDPNARLVLFVGQRVVAGSQRFKRAVADPLFHSRHRTDDAVFLVRSGARHHRADVGIERLGLFHADVELGRQTSQGRYGAGSVKSHALLSSKRCLVAPSDSASGVGYFTRASRSATRCCKFFTTLSTVLPSSLVTKP